MSDSVRPHRRQPTRLPRPWDSPGKNTGVGCHFLLQCMKVESESEVAQSCSTLSDPMDCSPSGSSVHGISWQESWRGLPFPPPGDLPDPGIEPESPTSALEADSFLLNHRGSNKGEVENTDWRRKWQPTPVFLPEESQGRGSLVGCRLWGRKEVDTTEAT